MERRPRVLIVDDHAAYRRQARFLLDDEGLDVVGEAWDGPSCVSAVRALQPDLVVLDVRLPGEDGFSIAERLAGESPPPIVVLTSSRPEEAYRSQIAASSAAGFVAKPDLTGSRLLALLRAGWSG